MVDKDECPRNLLFHILIEIKEEVKNLAILCSIFMIFNFFLSPNLPITLDGRMEWIS